MRIVFADTSYYVARLNRRDRQHAAAVDLTRNFSRRIVTTPWVLTELGNFLVRGTHRRALVEFVADLVNDDSVDLCEPSMTLFRSGLQLFAQRPDKEWSLTDCISIVLMQDRDLSEVVSADRHFEQAGFTCLLSTAG